jgi:hypothetical protein
VLVLDVLPRGKEAFLSHIGDDGPKEFVLDVLHSWKATLSNTQAVVEKTFLEWDHQSRGDGGSKRKATEAAGKGASTHVTKEAKVAVASVVHRSARDTIDRNKPEKKQKQRVAAKEDVCAAVEADFNRLVFSDAELDRGKRDAATAQGFFRQPRSGISEEVLAVFHALEQEAENWSSPRKPMSVLLEEGKQLQISLHTTCSAACLKVGKTSKKGQSWHRNFVRYMLESVSCQVHGG